MSKSVWFTITSSRWKFVLIYLWYSRFNVLCVVNDDIDHRPQCTAMSSVWMYVCVCEWVSSKVCVCVCVFSTTCARPLNIYCAREVTNSIELILSIQQLCMDREHWKWIFAERLLADAIKMSNCSHIVFNACERLRFSCVIFLLWLHGVAQVVGAS